MTTKNDTVRTQLASMSLQVASLTKALETKETENIALKQQNIGLANVIETDLKSDFILRIQAASKGKYQPNELQTMNIDQLKTIDEVLVKSGAFDSTATFKSIRAGSSGFDHSSRLTVGSLYKTGE